MGNPMSRCTRAGLAVAAFLPLIAVHDGQAAGALTGTDVVAVAASFQGVPYKVGGSTPKGFDCSGYAQYVYRQVGVGLPRTAAQQYAAVPHVPWSQHQAGDLLFLTQRRRVVHVGIDAGDGTWWVARKVGTRIGKQRLWTSFLVGRPALPTPTPTAPPTTAAPPTTLAPATTTTTSTLPASTTTSTTAAPPSTTSTTAAG